MYTNQQEERELVKWWEDFESLWESSTDNNGDKNTFEFERLKDFIRNLIAQATLAERKRILKFLKTTPTFQDLKDYLTTLEK